MSYPFDIVTFIANANGVLVKTILILIFHISYILLGFVIMLHCWLQPLKYNNTYCNIPSVYCVFVEFEPSELQY
jgi:hypothetical protein